MKSLLIRFAFGAITMLLLDYIWLGQIMNHFYLEQLRPVLLIEEGRISPRMGGAVAVYITMLSGILYFGFRLPERGKINPCFHTALLGLFCFAVYDLTNYSTLSHWSLKVVLADSLWGSVLFGTTRWGMGLGDRLFYRAAK